MRRHTRLSPSPPRISDDLAANGRPSWTGRFAYAVTPPSSPPPPGRPGGAREYLAFVEAAGVARRAAGGARRVVVAADVSESVIDAVGDGPLMAADRRRAAARDRLVPRGRDGARRPRDLLWYDVTEAAVVRAPSRRRSVSFSPMRIAKTVELLGAPDAVFRVRASAAFRNRRAWPAPSIHAVEIDVTDDHRHPNPPDHADGRLPGHRQVHRRQPPSSSTRSRNRRTPTAPARQ